MEGEDDCEQGKVGDVPSRGSWRQSGRARVGIVSVSVVEKALPSLAVHLHAHHNIGLPMRAVRVSMAVAMPMIMMTMMMITLDRDSKHGAQPVLHGAPEGRRCKFGRLVKCLKVER